MKKFGVGLLSAFLVITSTMIPVNAESRIETQVSEILSSMTLKQKVGQILQPDTRSITPQQVGEYYIGSILSGGGAQPEQGNTAQDWANRLDEYQKAAIDTFGIPLLYGVDAVHGNNNVKDSTIFPHNIGLGQANDVDLVKQIGRITAQEIRAIGATWAFTPTLGLPQNERWGRTYECFSETSDVASQLGSAYIEGLQGDLSQNHSIGTAKHYIGEGLTYNGTNQGDVNGQLFYSQLEELLKPYRAAIASDVKSVMVSYNSIDNVKCHGNKDLITDILKGQLGFKGIVITDYNGVDQIEGNLSYKQKLIKSINAGMDMIMIDGNEGDSPKWMIARNSIIEAVNEGHISMERLEDAVKRILTVKCELNFIDNPSLAYADKTLLSQFGSQQHRTVAREAVRKSLTLLKNTETANGSTLMLDLKKMKKIAVAGISADDIGIQCGGWTMTWQGSTGNITKGTTIYSGLREVAQNDQIIDYAANGYFSDDDYEAAIVVVGERPYAESNGDRVARDLSLPSSDIETIERIHKNHPDLPIIAVLTTGRPITIADQVDDLDAIVMAGLPGSEGAGVADVLLGDYDFNGHLTMTWPWYAQDIESKFTDQTKVMFEYGRGLTKNQVTAISQTPPNNPTVINLAQTNGIIEAENYYTKHNSIILENNNTSIGYFWQGYDISYKVIVPEQARYTLNLNAATENDNVKAAFDVYIDDVLSYSTSTLAKNTGGWAKFEAIEMNDKISLPSGQHIIKFVSQTKDLNIDYFKFIKFDDQYIEPENPNQPSIGTGALIKEDAVQVTMSSSEHSGDMSWYAGDQDIENRNAPKDPLDIRNPDTSDITTIVVDDNQKYQSVLGMGTSIEESTVNNLMKMSVTTRKKFIKQLVDPQTGMGNTLFRITIGTADFTGRDFYTYYDGTGTELNGNPDWDNSTGHGFSIQKDRDYGIIQVIKEIQQIAQECGVEKDLKFFASSWTPPGWMKLPTSASSSYPNNGLLLKGGQLNDRYIQDLAKYYVRFIEEYKKEGIPLYAMTLQNEPLLEINYPSCLITGGQEAKLAKAIKEELNKSTVLLTDEKDVKVWAFDHNFDGAEAYVSELFATQDGRDNVDGIAFHPYGGVPSTMGSLYEQYKNKYTMNLTERSVWGASGANDIISWFRNGSESYNAWVTMLDSKIAPHQWVGTPDPTMFVQDANHREKYWCTPEVYLIGQFTKYVRPGYERILSTNGNTSTVTNVAFRDPKTGKIIMIVANSSGSAQNFKVISHGTQFNATLPAGNVATYIWEPVDGNQFKNITDDLTLNDAIIEGSGVINNGELGYIDSTTKVNYTVNVKQAGTYRVEFDVAVGGEWHKDFPVVISQGNKELGRTHARRYVYWDNAEWSTYSTIQTYITLSETGLQNITLSFPEAGINFKDVRFIPAREIQSLPGKLDTTNYFNKSGCVLESENFGFIDRDYYLDYKVNVLKAGDYDFDFEVATSQNNSGVWIDKIDMNNQVSNLGEIDFTNTGGTNLYTHQIKRLHLDEGHYTMRIKFKAGETNFKGVVIGQAMSLQSDELIERQLHGHVINVHLIGGSFALNLTKNAWHLNFPKGVDYEVQRIDDTNAKIVLQGEIEQDFDNDLSILLKVDASEFGGIVGTSLEDYILIKAIDDIETLTSMSEIPYHQDTFNMSIQGGTFKEDVIHHVTLAGEITQYVTIQKVTKVSSRLLSITLQWKPMYNDCKGTIIITPDGYSDGVLSLEKELIFKQTDQLPPTIPVGNNNPVDLTESLAYRHKGSLVNQPAKGNYIDFFLDIQTAGKYTIYYDITNTEAVANGLKISGGLGLATDNLESISFHKFWGNELGYWHTLDLKEGKQTLRFEMNNYNDGFKIDHIRIAKVQSAIEVQGNTTIVVNQLIDGSKTKGWGIETKNGIANIGCSESGAYQDYHINVKKDGYYQFSINAAYNGGSHANAILQLINNQTSYVKSTSQSVTELGKVQITQTGDWGNFVNSDKVLVKLSAGEQTIRIYDEGDGFNYRSFDLDYVKEFNEV